MGTDFLARKRAKAYRKSFSREEERRNRKKPGPPRKLRGACHSLDALTGAPAAPARRAAPPPRRAAAGVVSFVDGDAEARGAKKRKRAQGGSDDDDGAGAPARQRSKPPKGGGRAEPCDEDVRVCAEHLKPARVAKLLAAAAGEGAPRSAPGVLVLAATAKRAAAAHAALAAALAARGAPTAASPTLLSPAAAAVGALRGFACGRVRGLVAGADDLDALAAAAGGAPPPRCGTLVLHDFPGSLAEYEKLVAAHRARRVVALVTLEAAPLAARLAAALRARGQPVDPALDKLAAAMRVAAAKLAAAVPPPPAAAAPPVRHDGAAAAAAEPPPEFQAAKRFDGARAGMIFTHGELGLGYYRDAAAARPRGGAPAAVRRQHKSVSRRPIGRAPGDAPAAKKAR